MNNSKFYSVTWQNVEYNIGNTFSASTGIFTCPLDGIYAFYATSPIQDSQTWIINADERAISISFIYIYVNGSKKVFHQDVGDRSFKLKQGDTVHIGMSGYFSDAERGRGNLRCVRNHCVTITCDETYFHGYLVNLL